MGGIGFMIQPDSGEARLRKFNVSLMCVFCALALPSFAQTTSMPAPASKPASAQATPDAISQTLQNAAGTPPPASAPAAQTAADQNAQQNVGNENLPPLPTDAESLKTLTQALASDKSGMDQKDPRSTAFDAAVNHTFPLTPEQIKQVMQRMSESQEAGRAPPEPDPKAVVKIEDVSLDPGAQPPLIEVAAGYVTTVNVLDITGQPWPIQDVVVGGNFQVTGPNDANVLRIIPQTRFGHGNLSVRLVGLTTPVTFRVEAGDPEVYYRYDARIPQSGPGAKQSLINHGFTGEAGDGTMMAVLEGVPPADAKKMLINGTDGRTRAWKIDDAVYLRTPLTLLSPGWDSSVRSADGTNVYMMSDAPVLMLSDNGQMIRATVAAPPEDVFHTNDLKEGKVTVPVNANGTVAMAPQPTDSSTTPPPISPAVASAQAAAAQPVTPPTNNGMAPLTRPNSGVQIYVPNSGGYNPGYSPTTLNNTNTNNTNTNGGTR